MGNLFVLFLRCFLEEGYSPRYYNRRALAILKRSRYLTRIKVCTKACAQASTDQPKARCQDVVDARPALMRRPKGFGVGR